MSISTKVTLKCLVIVAIVLSVAIGGFKFGQFVRVKYDESIQQAYDEGYGDGISDTMEAIEKVNAVNHAIQNVQHVLTWN